MAPVGRRRALNEDEVLDAALALLDEGGPAAASIRGIAARVGVAPNAVYTYFADKAAVNRALVERLLGASDHGVFADPARDWRERVEALATDLRTRMVAHPGAAALLMSGPMDGPRATALGEQLLDVLLAGGLQPDEAARATYLLIVYVLGSIALEVADEPEPGPLPSEAERIADRRRVFDQIPPDVFPRSAAAVPIMAGYISTEQYLWGLNRLLDGVSPRP
ncbi:TetR/AcrR family transcriptional regulator [Kribbella sp. NBC_01505]|uniref:TetR/AcrR family transcriptional regulator n=1 Tax=Kribbella sp. NBC_01505 TaxID=2903580 RepID=UPI0038700369